MCSQTGNSSSSERPTDRQMVQLFRGIEKQWVTKDSLQTFLTSVYMRGKGQSVPEPKQLEVNRVLAQVLYGAEKFFPEAVPDIVALLKPYTELGNGEFKVAKLDWKKEKYDDYQRLKEALFWVDIKDVRVLVIGANWKPTYEPNCYAHRDRFREVVNSVFREAIETRVNMDSQCVENARSAVLLYMEGLLNNFFNQTGAFRYHLVSSHDVFMLSGSILKALVKAVVLTAIQHDNSRVKRIMRFVDFQLSGTPIIDVENGVVSILSAPPE